MAARLAPSTLDHAVPVPDPLSDNFGALPDRCRRSVAPGCHELAICSVWKGTASKLPCFRFGGGGVQHAGGARRRNGVIDDSAGDRR